LLQGAPLFGDELPIYGLIALSQGALLVSMIWTAAIAFLLDRRFLPAAGWLLAAAGLSCLGLIHAYRITGRGIETILGIFAAPAFALSYLAAAAFLVVFHVYATRHPTVVQPGEIL
jgi:AGZA family xanthine/uracil permease-like MFS transporter